MSDLKTYTVTISKSEVTTSTAAIEIKAKCPEDAHVLAQYYELRSWDWKTTGEPEETQEISSVTLVPDAVAELDIEPAPVPMPVVIPEDGGFL